MCYPLILCGEEIMSGAKGPTQCQDPQKRTKGWEKSTTCETRCSWTAQDAKLVKQEKFQAERKEHHKSSTLYHMVPSYSNDESNILR
jgi:hypothetical protein